MRIKARLAINNSKLLAATSIIEDIEASDYDSETQKYVVMC